ncbi:MAG: hypothetical protein P1P89_12555 [Desulfobacterales bacterium]|nr:hypothetical protein [Desulfobacterales bacterium]
MKKTIALCLLLVLGVFIGNAFGVEVTLLGSNQYMRTSGGSDLYTDIFIGVPGEGRLVVKNGNQDGDNRITDAVSSAVVKVNGVEIFGQNDFNQQVYLLEAPVNLSESNTISVELWSRPDSYLTVEVIEDIAPPIVSITANPGTVSIGAAAVLTWSAANADACIIEPGIGAVAANGSVTVSPAQTTTYTLTATNLGSAASAGVTVSVIYPPVITLIEPDGSDDNADASYTITWIDADSDSNAAISLYYDADNSGADGTLIINGLAEDPDQPEDDAYVWDTSEIPQGEYYIYAVIDDGVHTPAVAYSDGTVNIVHSLPAEIKLTPADLAAGDVFGQSAAISGDTAIIGAPHDDDGGYYSGSAYIYKRIGDAFIQQAKLTAADASAYDYFGWSVAIQGDTAVVGAYGDDGGESSGSVYIFTRTGETWTQQAKLTAGDAEAYDYFGWSVAISGDTVIAGAYGNDDAGESSGAAYIFTRTGEAWTQQAKLTAADAAAYDYFGKSVSINGDYAIVGAHGSDDRGESSGAAYVFMWNGSGWIQDAKLTAGDGEAYDNFGVSVAVSGNHAVVGASGDDDGGIDSGAAYIFSTSSPWTQQIKLTGANAGAYAHFGYSVAIGSINLPGNLYVAVGAPGYAYPTLGYPAGAVYGYSGYGSKWNMQRIITASNPAPDSRFGSAVSVSSGAALVGAPRSSSTGQNSGAAYVVSLCTVHISAAPEIIYTGQSATLAWNSTNADNLSIEPGIGAVPSSGSRAVSPSQTTTYTISASGPGGIATDSVAVTVVDPSVPPMVNISANTTSIYEGGYLTLIWNSENAESCSIAPGGAVKFFV